MAEKRDEKLPCWAQSLISELRVHIQLLQNENDVLRSMSTFTVGDKRDWFTIPGPAFEPDEEVRRLYVLNRNDPLPICSLSKKDLLFVGRAK